MEMKNDDIDLRQCERECNEQFMSIKPVEQTWVGIGMTLFSQSPRQMETETHSNLRAQLAMENGQKQYIDIH